MSAISTPGHKKQAHESTQETEMKKQETPEVKLSSTSPATPPAPATTPLVQGSVTVQMPSSVPLLPKAGKMSAKEVKQASKAKPGLSLTAQRTAQELSEAGGRVTLPQTLDLSQLVTQAQQADALVPVITNLETALMLVKQNYLLLSSGVHTQLGQIMRFVRAHLASDPRLLELLPELVEYFAHAKPAPTTPEPPAPQPPAATSK